MNIYEKIQKVKLELSKRELKKSGENKFSNFKYYELGDFLPSIIELCTKVGLFTHIDFTEEQATLTIINTEPTIDRVDNEEYKIHDEVFYSCPMKELELKGANAIQALGGAQTYLRRYLYMNAFDIVEADMFDNEEFTKKQKEKKEKGSLEELIDKCKAEFKNATAESKQEIANMLKTLGYSTFADLKKNQVKEDIVSLATTLRIDIPADLVEEVETK